MRAVAVFIILGSLPFASCGPSVRAQTTQISPRGTYRLHVCKAPCSPGTGNSVAEGTLVIVRDRFDASTIPEPARSYFLEKEFRLLTVIAEERPNACFVLRGPRNHETLAGASLVAMTLWEPNAAGGGNFDLYSSPDASYGTWLRPAGEHLEGRGSSRAPGATPSVDSIFAERIGPPDLGLCYRAASESQS
jgi:hypothetical protein